MKRILLIAVKEALLELFSQALSTDYELEHVKSEKEGLSTLEADSQHYAAVLIELALTRESGFRFADEIEGRLKFSSIPMIAISDLPPTLLDMDCFEHSFLDLITVDSPAPLIRRRLWNAVRARDFLANRQIESMLKELPSNIYLKDAEGRYLFSSHYWRHLDMGNDPDWTILGKTDLEVRRDKENARKAMESDRRILETGKGAEYIIEENEDGIREFLQLIKKPVYDEQGRICGIIALINNVTDYQLMKLELERQAKTDQLTGLLNRSALKKQITSILSEDGDLEQSALLMIDADYFKAINDTFGHTVGDHVLAEIGCVLREVCGPDDIAGRMGGDEFLLFMERAGEREACLQAKKMQLKISDRFLGTQLEGHVCFSIGIALYPENGRQFEELYRAADTALYHVKNEGRGGFRVCRSWEPSDPMNPRGISS